MLLGFRFEHAKATPMQARTPATPPTEAPIIMFVFKDWSFKFSSGIVFFSTDPVGVVDVNVIEFESIIALVVAPFFSVDKA